MFDRNLIVGLIVLAVVVMGVYMYAPRIRSMLSGLEGFQDAAAKKNGKVPGPVKTPAANGVPAAVHAEPGKGAADKMAPAAMPVPAGAAKEGFADYASYGSDSMASVPMAAAKKPQGCYPREQMNPMELLPNDPNSQWAQVNPQGTGDIQGKNFLSAGALIGVNTVGQSLRNASYDLRAEPPNPQQQVSPWLQSTIEPDLSRRNLE